MMKRKATEAVEMELQERTFGNNRVILAYEIYNGVAEAFATRREDADVSLPRMCHWVTRKWHKNHAPSHSDVVAAFSSSPCEDACGMLTPTDAELLSAHYISGDFVVSNECVVTRRMSELMSRRLKLGCLKILQMGNTDPNNTKAGKQIRGQASVRRAKNQLIMQHVIIDAMKCMRAIKDRIARPVYQLAIISSASIPARCINRGNHWHNSSVVQSQRGFQSGHQSIVNQAQDKLSRTSNLLRKLNKQLMSSSNQNFSVAIPTVKNLTPVLLVGKVLASNTKLRTVGISYQTAGTSEITIGFHYTKKSAASGSSPRSFHSFKWVTIERSSHRDSSATKIAQIIGGER
ncbi:hypothetical protein F511_36694 [Dorcoceras hygrometricum]|uniref:Uncharacterized protein n=1 Tax=Dorcoceras hygrometricum TaxID=472368 RepID=A0A2Z7DC97_9LAMI|nr:hypothetical protein F511_36694 [Dorcoceras hygrometricum]